MIAVPGDAHLVWVGRVAVITLPTEVDLSNAEDIRADLSAVLDQGASMIIADMTTTAFCDSAGVRTLVRVARKAAAQGAGMRLATSAPAVTRVLGLTGVDKLIEVYQSVAAALAGSEAGPRKGDLAQPGHTGSTDPGGHTFRPG